MKKRAPKRTLKERALFLAGQLPRISEEIEVKITATKTATQFWNRERPIKKIRKPFAGHKEGFHTL